MKITPIEVRKYEFKRTLRGYDPDEVRYFLEMMADELEALNREKHEMEAKVQQSQSQLEEYRQIEKSMQDALIVAKETSDRSLANSKKESKLIIAEAEAKADRIIENAHKQANKIEQEITQLRVQREGFVVKLKYLLRAQSEILDAFNEAEEDLEDVKFEDIGGERFDVEKLKEEIRKLNNDIYEGVPENSDAEDEDATTRAEEDPTN